MDPTYPLVPIANFLGIILVLFPLLSTELLKKWNTGVCMFAIWNAVECLITGINAIIWSDNVNIVAPVWCDITTHIGVGSFVAFPACSLVITRRIFLITHNRGFATEKQEKRREILFDLSLCLGLPILVMSLYYIVQEVRFEVWEEEGCNSTVSAPGLYVLLVDGWTLILPVISVVFYCPRAIWALYHYRRETNEFLDTNTILSRGNYYRIMALGCIDALFTLPVTILGTIMDNADSSLGFWPGWSVVHANFSTIPQVPKSQWSADFWVAFGVKFNEWINPICSVIFFLILGLTESARASYARTFWMVAKPLGIGPRVKMTEGVSTIQFGTVPDDSTVSDSKKPHTLLDRIDSASASNVRQSSELNADKSTSLAVTDKELYRV